MTVLLLALTASAAEIEDLDTPDPAAGSQAPSGRAIAGFGGAHGVGLSEQVVVGGDGGTAITTLSTRVVVDTVTLTARLPFAAYATPDDRDTGLGNLQLEALAALPTTTGLEHALGASVGFGLGGSAFTWATRADEVWPGAGLELVYEARARSGQTTWLARGALGVHGSGGWEPVPGTWARALAAGGVDQALGRRVGLVAEASLAWWDVAPAQTAALVRLDPTDGLRFRGGLVLPWFTWAGWDPLHRPAGAREATVHLDVGASL